MQYSEFVERLLGHGEGEWLRKLHPAEPLKGYAGELLLIRQATDAELSGDRPTGPHFSAIRAALFYFFDALPEAEQVLRPLSGELSAYWRGMVWRRIPDFEVARNEHRQAGELPIFRKMHQASSAFSPVMARQYTWDPYLFTGLCEQHKFGEESLADELVRLQRVEFEALFDYTWRRNVEA